MQSHDRTDIVSQTCYNILLIMLPNSKTLVVYVADVLLVICSNGSVHSI